MIPVFHELRLYMEILKYGSIMTSFKMSRDSRVCGINCLVMSSVIEPFNNIISVDDYTKVFM